MSDRRPIRTRHVGADVRLPVWVEDAALASGVAAVGAAFALSDPLAAVLSVALGASLAVRRTLPALALAWATAAAGAHALLLTGPTAAVIAVPVLVHGLARWSRRAPARVGLGVALAGAVVGPVRWLTTGEEAVAAGDVLTTVAAHAGVVLVAYALGRRGRDRADRAAAEAVAEERGRIAREVHDIVAHSLSVIAVQAEGGRALAARGPERTFEVLSVVSATAREALEDMREMVALLRRGDTPGSPEGNRPPPGLADLGELVGGLGGRARLRVDGPPAAVGSVLGLTVYRLVQESATNFLRHAGSAAVLDVLVVVTAEAVEVHVSDDGLGSAARDDGRGHGLRAMRERVRLHGGTMVCGPRAPEGFGLHAVLPLRTPTEEGVRP
ncbi:histidine kinase [Nocardiopsis sp. EMB25]|uniref:sensor histidine kinase n=1 Tax=Nocardiopsis sp. EMB25 TaxID=2835867 RepID=UPI002283853A|nr:histidine kinase [Nocardiopsis sp. EMB25]MCY9787869.1 histidine kinase [Nocardiopsis sp. EMB25]